MCNYDELKVRQKAILHTEDLIAEMVKADSPHARQMFAAEIAQTLRGMKMVIEFKLKNNVYDDNGHTKGETS